MASGSLNAADSIHFALHLSSLNTRILTVVLPSCTGIPQNSVQTTLISTMLVDKRCNQNCEQHLKNKFYIM